MSSTSVPITLFQVGVIFKVIIFIVDPIGYTPPRLPPKSKLDAVSGRTDVEVVLPCDAQASPLPRFRSVAHETYLTPH